MLGRLSKLHENVLRIKKNLWIVEERIINEIDEKISELEVICNKKTEKLIVPLNFANVLIPYYRKRLDTVKDILKTGTPEQKDKWRKASETFQHLCNSHKSLLIEVEKINKTLADFSLTLKKDHPAVRKAVSNLPDAKQKLEVISQLDGIVSLPIIITIFEEMKVLNQATLWGLIAKTFGKELRAEASFDDMRLKLKVNIEATFKEFCNAHAYEKMPEEDTRKQVNETVNKLCEAISKKLGVGIKDQAAHQELKEHLKLDIYFCCTLIAYHKTNAVQSGEKLAKLDFTMMSQAGIINPSIALTQFATLCNPYPEIEDKLREAALWLRGLYLRSYTLMPDYLCVNVTNSHESLLELGKKSYITGSEDEDLYYYKKMTKFFMALYHKLHAEALEKKWELKKDSSADNKAPLSHIVIHSRLGSPIGRSSTPPLIPLDSNQLGTSLANDVVPEQVQVDFKQDDQSIIIIKLQLQDTAKLNRLLKVAGKLIGHGLYCSENEFRQDLRLESQDDPTVKIKRLKDCTYKYELTSSQDDLLRFAHVAVKNAFTAYAKLSRMLFLPRLHMEKATAVDAALTLKENISSREILINLFQLLKQLKQASSEKLFNAINDILVDCYNVLLKGSNHADQNSVPAVPHDHPVKLIKHADCFELQLRITDMALREKLTIKLGLFLSSGVMLNEGQEMQAKLLEHDNFQFNDEERINLLHNLICYYKLSKSQCDTLNFISHEVKEKFADYLTSSRLFGFGYKKHYTLGMQAQQDVWSHPDDPKKQLEVIYKLRRELIRLDSGTLLDIVNALLLKVYRVLSGKQYVNNLSMTA